MKIVNLIARLLLGLIFVVFGLNGFFNFLNMGPMPSGLAGQFVAALVTVSLLLGGRCATSRRRCAAACESVRAPWSGAAWTCNCEHHSVSPILESEWRSFGNRCSNPVVDCLRCASPILLRDICATYVRFMRDAIRSEWICRIRSGVMAQSTYQI